jgi:Uma2 family endonuclease
MTAQPTGPGAPRPWAPDTARLRSADYTIEDVLTLPDDAPRVELSDGVLIVVPSPTNGHQRIGYRLCRWLDDNAPQEFEPSLAVGVSVNAKTTFEPDVVLLHRPVTMEHHFSAPERVAIVVEVVSPGTKRRDRFEKPADYAAAGIKHYWRIEQNPVHVYAYELGKDGRYQLVADSDTELVLTAPFDIRLPIEAITP